MAIQGSGEGYVHCLVLPKDINGPDTGAALVAWDNNEQDSMVRRLNETQAGTDAEVSEMEATSAELRKTHLKDYFYHVAPVTLYSDDQVVDIT
jgi:hypothetical protein